jgi:hypothetical protein
LAVCQAMFNCDQPEWQPRAEISSATSRRSARRRWARESWPASSASWAARSMASYSRLCSCSTAIDSSVARRARTGTRGRPSRTPLVHDLAGSVSVRGKPGRRDPVLGPRVTRASSDIGSVARSMLEDANHDVYGVVHELGNLSRGPLVDFRRFAWTRPFFRWRSRSRHQARRHTPTTGPAADGAGRGGPR